MHRTRDESRHTFTHHASANEFLREPPRNGAHTVIVKEQPLDLLIQDRSSPVTLDDIEAAQENHTTETGHATFEYI